VRTTNKITLILLFILVRYVLPTGAQEFAGHLNCNPNIFNKQRPLLPVKKTTTAAEPLPLPFFEDFTGYGVFPDSSKWTNYEVYINNTMCNKPISRGVATFDALDWRGIPYDSFNNTAHKYCDSLTSQPINLSLNVVSPGDSLYLSFFYQPQGNGFFPEEQDSLMLFMKTRFGGFVKIWSTQGTALKPFKQVMIPITDSLYFDSFYQFMFVNIGALNWADAIWNVDYVRLHAGRTFDDTAINDIGFSSDPSFLLNDYTSMPYRQYFGYSSAERSSTYVSKLRNNYNSPLTATYGYTGTVLNTGTVLKSVTWSALSVPSLTTNNLLFPAYSTLIPLTTVGNYTKVIFQNKYYIQSTSPTDPPENDTVVRDCIFDNYLAYDDGTAEKSYYLNLYPTLPGKIAIEYHLNKPDTMRGMAIYFGRQIPFASNKTFNIDVHSSLAGVYGSPTDHLIYTQEYCDPGYADTINHFWIYRFSAPVPMPAGTFFAGAFLPAESGSDSLYFGLDVNRVGSNHAFFNVLSGWTPSLISGAIMMRPLFGLEVPVTTVKYINKSLRRFSVYPNPATNIIQFEYEGDSKSNFTIADITGRNVMQGTATNGSQIDITTLASGIYFVRLIDGDLAYEIQKIIKL
jgi:hypothetical protein